MIDASLFKASLPSVCRVDRICSCPVRVRRRVGGRFRLLGHRPRAVYAPVLFLFTCGDDAPLVVLRLCVPMWGRWSVVAKSWLVADLFVVLRPAASPPSLAWQRACHTVFVLPLSRGDPPGSIVLLWRPSSHRAFADSVRHRARPASCGAILECSRRSPGTDRCRSLTMRAVKPHNPQQLVHA